LKKGLRAVNGNVKKLDLDLISLLSCIILNEDLIDKAVENDTIYKVLKTISYNIKNPELLR